jgi:hypothetical protein
MKKAVVFLLLCLVQIPLWSDVPAPPPWIYGQWQTMVEAEEGNEAIVIIFTGSDILINGASVLQMIIEGYISSFNQLIQDNIYTIRIEYADGFWWEESFPMPSMTSVYTDESYEEGGYDTMTYFFIPLRIGPAPSPVPSDFN